MADVPTNHILFDPLTKSVQGGKCVAFIGAGMSIPDYPNWSDLVKEIQAARGLKAEENEENFSFKITGPTTKSDEEVFWSTIRERFARKHPLKTNVEMKYHFLYRAPFHSYISTNFDPILVDIFSLHSNVRFWSYPDLPNNLRDEGMLYLMHGRVDPEEDQDVPKIVLTPPTFKEAYDPEVSLLPDLLRDIFLRHDVCFMGCGFKDENLAGVLKICRNIRKTYWKPTMPNPPRWYALVENDEELPDGMDGCGIEIVTFGKGDQDFKGLTEILKSFAKHTLPKQERFTDRGGDVYRADERPPL